MLNAGESLAQFRIVRKLGEGGMGEVYLAEDTKLNRQVALKTLRDDYFDDEDRRVRFEREAKTAAQIQHPNIMAIFDIGAAPSTAGGREIHYIVMEYIRGKHLSEYLSDQSMDIGKKLRIAEKIASGLAAAHKLSIVHRDIKPDNIIVDEHEEPKILDFGLAKPMTPLQASEATQAVSGATVKADVTKVGTVIGTVAYMSPEQARGETVDLRSDIFSFGVLLYRMFAGEMPFTGQSQVSILAKILETPHPPVRQLQPDIDPEIERIIDKCLQKDANERYQDTRDLVIDLRNLRRQYDSGVSSTVSGIRTQKEFQSQVKQEASRQRRKRLMIVLPLVVIVISASYLLFPKGDELGISSAEAREYTLAILNFENKTGDANLDWLETGLPEILITDLAQGQRVNIISQNKLLEAMGKNAKELESIGYEEQVKAARKLGAVNVMSGAIYKLGDKFRIDARLEDAKSGKVLMGEKVIGNDPFNVVDSLTTRIAASLNLGELMTLDRGVAQLTTSDPEAYRYYHSGLQKFGSQLWDAAVADFEKAIEIDSTFALPYLRIGMTYMFRGEQQRGATYFAKVKRYEDKLGDRDRSLIDAYYDLWFRQEFDDAMNKLKNLVDKYPEDYEAKSVYAILRLQLARDTVGAVAMLDEILQNEPRNQVALNYQVFVNQSIKRHDKAIEYLNRFKEYYPESPISYRGLASSYTQLGELEKATAAYEEYHQRFPDDPEPITSLATNSIRLRDFAKAEAYLEQLPRFHSDDPLQMQTYYELKAGLANWSGKFRTSLGYRFKAIQEAEKLNDSARIFEAWRVLSSYYEQYGFTDSAIYYLQDKRGYAPFIAKVNFSIAMVGLDKSLADSLRPIMTRDLNDIRSRLPKEMQNIMDGVPQLFEAFAQADTAAMIAAFSSLQKLGGTGGDITRSLGELASLSGDYRQGKEWLEEYLFEGTPVVNGFYYPLSIYLLGVACEGLGQKSEAIKYYEEMLRYWSHPEIEIPQIRDAKARLARLRS